MHNADVRLELIKFFPNSFTVINLNYFNYNIGELFFYTSTPVFQMLKKKKCSLLEIPTLTLIGQCEEMGNFHLL